MGNDDLAVKRGAFRMGQKWDVAQVRHATLNGRYVAGFRLRAA